MRLRDVKAADLALPLVLADPVRAAQIGRPRAQLVAPAERS